MASKTRWLELDNVSDRRIAIAIGLGVILSRWPLQVALLDSFDAVNYALALDHFDMRLHQPQPPGYPLYILLGRAFNLILHDHLAALVWLSTVFSALAVIGIYVAGREMFGRRAGVIAALLLGTSTLFWYLGEVAAPYTADLFASTVVGWLSYRVAKSSRRATVWVGAFAVGLAGAFRLQTLVFLLPLFLYSLRQRPWKEIAIAIAITGMIFGAFFLPAVMVSGGPSTFVRSMRSTVPLFDSTETLISSSKWIRFKGNADCILRYTIAALGELATLLALIGYGTRAERLRFWRNFRLLFLVIWVLPTWTVYFLIWPGNVGTILVCIPPFFLLAAVGLDWVMEQPRWGMAAGGVLLTIVLAWHIAVFTVLPEYPLGETYRRFDNYEGLEEKVKCYRAKLSLVNELPVEGTIVYAISFRHLQYYLPQYHTMLPPRPQRDNPDLLESTLSIQNGKVESRRNVDVKGLIPPATRHVVFFDLPPEAVSADQSLVEERSKDGQSIQIISIPASYSALWTRDGLLVRAQE
jgi:hypothetical protein